MSATTPRRGKPRRCPHCGATYAFRVRSRQDDGFGVVRHYRHRGPRGWVYFHEIEYEPSVTTDADGVVDL